MSRQKKTLSRRSALKAGAGTALIAGVAPTVFVRNAWAMKFRNDPSNVGKVVFGWNVPQTGAYADEGADEGPRVGLGTEKLQARLAASSPLELQRGPLSGDGNGRCDRPLHLRDCKALLVQYLPGEE